MRQDDGERTARSYTDAALPNLIVIGAPKCGTSSLHYYLDLHPEVSMSKPKELNFFVEPMSFASRGSDHSGNGDELIATPIGNWGRGVDWYASHFLATSPVRGESSPQYTAPWQPRVAERMASVVPEAKLVFMARDPIERAISFYRQLRAAGQESRPPDEILLDMGGRYAGHSCYFRCLSPFLERFPPERILIVTAEDLRHRRQDSMREIFQFAGVDPDFWSPKMIRERNRTAGRDTWRHRLLWRLRDVPPIRDAGLALPSEAKWQIERFAYRRDRSEGIEPSEEIRQRLAARLKDDTDALRAFTGRDFSEWSV